MAETKKEKKKLGLSTKILISLLAGAAGAVLSTAMVISSLKATPMGILLALLSCAVIWMAAGYVMVRFSFFQRKENLLLALRAFCDETHPLAFADITYSFYPVLCDLLHIPQHVILVEEDFSLDLSKYHGLNETIVIANPNAPTTLLQPVAAIEEVVRTNPDSIVIVDEAYIDFAGPNASCVPLTKKYDNVIVVQTFSKSHNLAGARVGFCVANPELIADMNRIKFSYSPYNVNSLSQAAAVAAMEDENYFRDTVGKICATRADTMTKLRERGFTGPDSATNFLFVTTSRMPCKQIFERLRQKGVLIRYFSAPRLSDYLRITIGTPEQMQRFFEELDLILG